MRLASAGAASGARKRLIGRPVESTSVRLDEGGGSGDAPAGSVEVKVVLLPRTLPSLGANSAIRLQSVGELKLLGPLFAGLTELIIELDPLTVPVAPQKIEPKVDVRSV